MANRLGTLVRQVDYYADSRGAFRSVPELQSAIQALIDAHQANPKPLVSTKTADDILTSVAQRTADVPAAQLLSRTTVTRNRPEETRATSFTVSRRTATHTAASTTNPLPVFHEIVAAVTLFRFVARAFARHLAFAIRRRRMRVI
jgi:hypothetical protein